MQTEDISNENQMRSMRKVELFAKMQILIDIYMSAKIETATYSDNNKKYTKNILTYVEIQGPDKNHQHHVLLGQNDVQQ